MVCLAAIIEPMKIAVVTSAQSGKLSITIREICVPTRTFSSPSGWHNQTDPLPSREDTFVYLPEEGAPRDCLAIGFNPEAMRDVAGRPSPRGSRRRVLFGSACCAVGGAMLGNQFQGRIFVGTSADALPISVDDPMMTNVLDCIFCHCGSTVRPPARLALA